MLPYVFHPLAAAELDEAVAHYENLAPGKGVELAQQVQAAIARLQQYPEFGAVLRGGIRALPVQPTTRWSYSLHYRVTPTGLRILAVAHQKRQPFYWFGRR